MRKVLINFLLFLCAITITAQTQERKISVTENIAYRTDVGPSTVLDLAEPLFGPQQDRPAILIIHGGGWSAGSKNDMVYRALMIDYAMKGYVVCNMNYRLVQEAPMPACIEDVQAAVKWMKANSQRLGIAPDRIGTYGHSAGGHLSLMAGLTAGVACAAGGAPPTEIGRAGEWNDHQEWWPIGHIGKSDVPFLVLQGGEDPVVKPDLTEDWVTKMQQAGSSVDYVKVHGNHGVAFDQQLQFTRPAMDAFYARHLKHQDPTVSFEQMKVPEFGGSGPNKAIAVREKSLTDFVVYHPVDMEAAMAGGRTWLGSLASEKRSKLPVLVFCNGGCMDTSIGYENMLTDLASYGYVVVAIGELQMFAQHEKDQHTPSSMVKKALDWICQQASDPVSPYYNKIDTEKIAAAGHSCGGAQVLANAADPRLKTYLILNAGMGKMTMADASAKSLKNLHGPILYLVGGKTDVAWQNAQIDYKTIKKNPVVLADNTQSGHGGTYEQPNGGANSRMVRAWLDWQLKGKQEPKRIFLDGDLTGYDNWTIQHKNFIQETKDFVKGADVGFLTMQEKRGVVFHDRNGRERECLELLKNDYQISAIRMRVWVNPRGGDCDKFALLAMAKRVKALGMDLMVDFHYSDWWADPAKQPIPKAWLGHPFEEMKQDVRNHTIEVLSLLKENGIAPRWVQVGNETTNGMLWSVKTNEQGWEIKDSLGRTTITHSMGHIKTEPQQYAGFIRAGYDAVKEVFPDAIVIVHLDRGHEQRLYDHNLDTILKYGGKFDMVGMSLYPYWAMDGHPELKADDIITDCIKNIRHVSEKYQCDVMIVETGYEVDESHPEKMEEGRRLLTRVIRESRSETNGHCRGVFYWEPQCLPGGYKLGAFDSKAAPTVIMDGFLQ